MLQEITTVPQAFLPPSRPIQIFRIDKRNNTLAEVSPPTHLLPSPLADRVSRRGDAEAGTRLQVVDDDVAAVLPEAAFALAKKSLHLVPSG